MDSSTHPSATGIPLTIQFSGTKDLAAVFRIMLAILLTAFAIPMPASGVQESAPPNVVILFSDDAGYADFGFQPNVMPEMKNLTPYIDTLARDGARFSNAYV